MATSSTFAAALACSFCAVLLGCASAPPPGPSPVVRTRAPVGYASAIRNYFAFKRLAPQKNTEIMVGKPEPGGCPLDGRITSSRGWVIPVVSETRTGTPTGKETMQITTKQYYFWFLGETIAGVTPRIELCP
jgi:hypothetical protein